MIIIQDLRVITVMYFDAYLKSRSPPPPNNLPQTHHSTYIQSNIKFNPSKPLNQQSNFTLNKAPSFQQMRTEINKTNPSAHPYLTAAKNSNMPPRAGNYPPKNQNFTGQFEQPPFIRQPLTDDQKYICHSPSKASNRPSAGLVFDQIIQHKFDYRRISEPNIQAEANKSFRESGANHNNCNQPQQRPLYDYHTIVPNQKTNSPIQIKFNSSNGSDYDAKSKLARKDTGQGLSFTQRQEIVGNKEPYSQRRIYKDYASLCQNKQTQLTSFESTIPKFANYSSRICPMADKTSLQSKKYDFDMKKTDQCKPSQQSLYKNTTTSNNSIASSQALKKQSSQEFLKKCSSSKFPQLDKTLEQDIESLRYAHKKSEDIMQREMNKNTYLNQLFQQKGLKINADDKSLDFKDTLKEKKEFAAKNIVFEREIQEKNKQIFEKNKQIFQKNRQISEKSKAIIDKNKQIQSLTQELRKNQKRQNPSEPSKKQLQSLEKIISEKSAKINLLQYEKRNITNDHLQKIEQKSRRIEQLQTMLSEVNCKITSMDKELKIMKQERIKSDRLILNLEVKNQDSVKVIRELKNEIAQLKQQFDIEKCQTALHHQQQFNNFIHKYQVQKSNISQNLSSTICHLQVNISTLTQKIRILSQDSQNNNKKYQQMKNIYQLLQTQYEQISAILSVQNNHQNLITRLREYTQTTKSENNPAKQNQKQQQYQMQKIQLQHLDRKCQQMSRQLKKIGLRLACTSVEAQQNGKILRDSNSQIILMNLRNLNEKYRFLLTEQ